MSKNPLANAFLAVLYISGIASLMYYAPKFEQKVDGVIVPIAVLSLFVLSAAVMAFLFFFQPFRLYFDGHKEEAVATLLKTIGGFAVITFLLFLSLFFVAQSV